MKLVQRMFMLGVALIVSQVTMAQEVSEVDKLVEDLTNHHNINAFCVGAAQMYPATLAQLKKEDRITLYVACNKIWSKDKANYEKYLVAVRDGKDVDNNTTYGNALSALDKASPVRRAVVSVAEKGRAACPVAAKVGRGLAVLEDANAKILDTACGDYFSQHGHKEAVKAVVRNNPGRLEALQRTRGPQAGATSKKKSGQERSDKDAAGDLVALLNDYYFTSAQDPQVLQNLAQVSAEYGKRLPNIAREMSQENRQWLCDTCLPVWENKHKSTYKIMTKTGPQGLPAVCQPANR